jgi:2-keto-4-pentenoate hydratase
VSTEELHRLAMQQLANYDAGTPNQIFARPLDLTMAEAYELQHDVVRLREQRGERVIGYKIGCTSKAIQEQLRIAEPIFGRIFDTGCFASGSRLAHANYANLAIEGELALRLGRDLPDSAAPDTEYLQAIDSIFPIIELHHHVLRSSSPCPQELIASNGMHAGFVRAEQPCSPSVDHLSIRINDEEVAATQNPWTMHGPIDSLRWLSQRLKQCGMRLVRGQVILTGSPLRLFPVPPGSRIVVQARPTGKSCAEIAP